jgi:hypothetical protein
MKQRIHHFLAAYKQTHFNRAFWVSPKWRLFVVLLVIATMFLVQDYLTGKYLAEFKESPLAFEALDKVMYWFGVGIVVGAAALFLMFEGEFAIGMWNHLRRAEQAALKEFAGLPAGKRKVRRKKKR